MPTMHSADCPCFDCYAEQDERDYQEHLAKAGSAAYNSHPDGCFYCGSAAHHSQDCQSREEC